MLTFAALVILPCASIVSCTLFVALPYVPAVTPVLLKPAVWSAQLNPPLPSVFKTWSASPSLFGNVNI